MQTLHVKCREIHTNYFTRGNIIYKYQKLSELKCLMETLHVKCREIHTNYFTRGNIIYKFQKLSEFKFTIHKCTLTADKSTEVTNYNKFPFTSPIQYLILTTDKSTKDTLLE